MMSGLITYALTCGGGTNAELHDKEVTLTTSDVTGSQTAIFEYDPQQEQPDPWDGYSLFTIDLSGVKEDIEALQQQLADAQECWEDVVEALQQYDPNYDPDEGECPSDEIPIVHDIIYQEGYIDGEASVNLGTKTITANGTYPANAESPPLDGFSSVTVTVAPNVGAKFITQNGTYLASSDSIDGYDRVVVDVQNCDCYTFDSDIPIEDIAKIVAGEPITTPNSAYSLDVYVNAFQWGVQDPEFYTGRTVYATAETGELAARMCADIIDEYGNVIRHYVDATNYSVFPTLNGYARIAGYSITNDVITIEMFIYRSDGWSSTKTHSFTDDLFADFATGPYTVTKNS